MNDDICYKCIKMNFIPVFVSCRGKILRTFATPESVQCSILQTISRTKYLVPPPPSYEDVQCGNLTECAVTDLFSFIKHVV